MKSLILTDSQKAIEEMFSENKSLKKELFNEKEHYKTLKENYDNVFEFIESELNVSDAFERYRNFLIKRCEK